MSSKNKRNRYSGRIIWYERVDRLCLRCNKMATYENGVCTECGFALFGDRCMIRSENKPPIGLCPREHHDKRVKAERFNEVCGAIARYYSAGLKIPVEWVQEYNDYIETNE
jgi:hypothetical protein